MGKIKIMKLLGVIFLLAVAWQGIASAQFLASGVFTDQYGADHYWYVTSGKHLIYDDEEFICVNGSNGIYYCKWDPSLATELNELKEDTPINEIISFGLNQDIIRTELKDYINCQNTDHGFSNDNGLGKTSRLLTIGGRVYRVTANMDSLCYYIYRVNITRPTYPHVFVAQTVNDQERYTTVRIQPPWDNVGGGVYTGRNHPCDTQAFNFMFVFYPRATEVTFTVSWSGYETTILANSGGAVSQVWVLDILDDFTDKPLDVYERAGYPVRRIGIYYSAPEYMYTLYGRTSTGIASNMDPFIEYLKFTGLNEVKMNAIDGSDISRTAHYAGSKFFTQADSSLADLLPRAQQNNIAVVPIVTSLEHPPTGADTWTTFTYQLNRANAYTSFFGDSLPDPLRPEAQSVMSDLLAEIANIASPYSCVPAVGFRSNGKIGFNYIGNPESGMSEEMSGYSQWDISQYNAEMGRAAPLSPPGTAHSWLRYSGFWSEWIDWRCTRVRTFWLSMRDKLRTYRSDWDLWVSFDLPSEAPGRNISCVNYGTSTLDILRYSGYNPNFFTGDTGVVLQRGFFAGGGEFFTNVGGWYATNPWAWKVWDYRPEVAGYFTSQEGYAMEVYQNYWEEYGYSGGSSELGGAWANFWGAATMQPLKRYFFQPFTYSVWKSNAQTMEAFSWERGTFGQEHGLRGFSRAFRGLPMVAPANFDGATSTLPVGATLWVKWFADRIAVVNDNPAKCTVTLTITRTLKQFEKLVDLSNNRVLMQTASSTVSPMIVTFLIQPYDLHTLCTFTLPADTTVSKNASHLILSSFLISSDGVSSCSVTVTVQSNSGVPLAGRVVAISTDREDSDTLSPSGSQTTDTNGQCTYSIRSEYTGGVMITASCESKTIDRCIYLYKPQAVGIWRFNEKSGTATFDVSGNSNTAYFSDTSVLRAAARFGPGIKLNGLSNYVFVPDSPTLDVTDVITVEAWVNVNSFTVNSEIMSRASNIIRFYIGQTDRALHVSQNYGGSTFDDSGTTALDAGRWYHVAYTYDGTTLAFYVNGELDKQVSRTGLLLTNDSQLLIGRYLTTFNGYIDEVRVYRRALSSYEVRASYYVRQEYNAFFSGRILLVPDSFSITVNNPSPALTVEIQGFTGKKSPFFTDTAAITCSSSGCSFSLDRLTWGAASVSMVSGYGYFYYRDNSAGVYTVTVSKTGLLIADTSVVSVLGQSRNETISCMVFTATKIKADGISGSSVTVVITDTFGYPIAGVAVTLASARADSDVFIPGSAQTTDGSGQCTWNVFSGYLGRDTITAFCDGATVSRIIDRSGAAAIWDFSTYDGTCTYDISGNKNNALFSSNPPYFAAGKFGPGLMFNGKDNYLTVPDTPSLDITEEISVMAWIYLNVFSPSAGFHNEIINKTEYNNMRFFVRQSNHRLCVTMTYGGGAGVDDGVAALLTGRWYHVAFTYDGFNLKMFINGDTDRTVPHTGLLAVNSQPVRIGWLDYNSMFNGIIDELKIYSRALSLEEIRGDYNARAYPVRFTATRLKFTSYPISVLQNNPTSEIDFEAQDETGNIDVLFNEKVYLTSSSASGKFSLTSSPWTDVTIFYAYAGAGKFYYKDAATGTHTITVSRPGYAPDAQQILVIADNPPYPGKAVKTLEYFIDQATGNRNSGVSYASPKFYLYIPESGFVLRTAFVEVAFQAGAVTVGANSAIGMNGANTTTFGALAVANTGDDVNFCLRYNATPALSGMSGSGANNGPYYVGVSIPTTRYNESVKLYLTYEYDEAANMQMKTVRYFAGSNSATLAVGNTQTFTHAPYTPETGFTIKSAWYEIRGNYYASGVGNALNANITLNSGSIQAGAKLVDGTARTVDEFLYLYKPTNPPNINQQNDLSILNAAAGTGAIYDLNAELVITYSYNYHASANLIQTIRRFLGQTDIVSAGAESPAKVYTQAIYFPEKTVSPVIRSIYTVFRVTNSGAIILNLGQNGLNTTSFAVQGGALNSGVAEGLNILYDLTPQFGSVSDGDNIIVSSYWSAAGGGSRSAELVYTYEYPKNPDSAQKTVFYGAASGYSIQDTYTWSNTRTLRNNIYLPDTNLGAIINACVYAKYSTGYNADCRLKIGVGSADADYITTDNDAEALYAERIKDATASITGEGLYNIRFSQTTTGNSLVQNLSSAVSYLTYRIEQGAAMQLAITSPERIADVSVPSDTITVEAQNNYDLKKTDFFDTIILSSSSATGRFSASSTTWQDTTNIYLSAGDGRFYYRDTLPGVFIITVSRQGLRPDTQVVSVTRVVSETVSYLRMGANTIPADGGTSVCTVSVFIMDANGFAVENRPVTLTASRGYAYSMILPSEVQILDTNGQCTFTVRSGYAGGDTFTAGCSEKVISENLVSNCSFENSWIFWDSGSAVVDTTVARTGSKSLKLRATGSNAYGGYGETLSVTNNSWSVYGISGYIRATVTAGTYLFSVLYYSDTDAYLGSNNIGSLTSTTGSWTGSSKTYGGSGSGAQYILPASCAKIRLRAGGWEGTPTGTGWTDDLRIKRVPSLTLTATKIKFATSPFSAQVNVPSDQVVVEAQGETGGKDTTFSGTISLTSTSSNGKFSLSELSWSDTSVVFMSSGSVIFFYKDSTVGFPQLTTDNWQLATDTQTETIIPVRTMSETASYIVFYPYKVASDGVSVCTCVAVINDSMGLPIKGKTVNLATLRGPAQDTVTGNPGTTNTKGQCTFTIKSGTGGQDTIVALCDSNTVTRGENRYNASGIWVFDQNINDISGSGNNAIIVNEPFYTQSRFGSCLLYDGSNDYAVVPHNPNLNPGTGSITLEAWVKTSQAPAEFEGDKVIARKDTAAGTRIFWGFNMGGWDAANIGKAAFQMYHAVNGNVAVMSNSAINNNQWHHLVGIRDASAGQIKLYVDGIQQGSPANESLGDMAGSESLTFANDASWFGPASAFQGLIDEVKVYQRVLTEQEIYQSYRSGANFYFTVLPGLKITSQPFTMTRNNPSPAITVEAQDDIGMRDTTFNNTCGLLSSSLTGRFSVDGIYWNTGNTTSINLTAGLGIFYYKDSSAGTPGITAYRLSLIADTQKETIVAPSTYETNSYIIISSSRVLPDGVSGCSLTIQVNDTYSYPVPGMLVSIYASRGNSTTLTPASAVTNAAGQCTFTVKSVNGGQDTITAVCETKTIRHGIDKLQAAAIWCFDDSSPVVFDISGKQNHGQSFNTDRVAGRYGTGLQIDGVNQDYVRVPDTDSLDIVDSLTISVWLKPLITDGNNKEVIEREWNHWRMWIVNDTLRTYFQIGGSGYLRDAGGSFPVADGTRWYHVVYRYSTQNIDVFIDGQNKGSWPATGNIQVSASPIYIGIYDDLSSDKYKGVFDEMRVYSRALSDGEISAMAGSGSAIIYFLTAPRLKITSAPFTVTRNNPSPDITVEARDECDFRDLNFNSTVTLSAGSSGGRFSPDRTTWSAGNTLVLTLAAGAGSFFYKDANTGTVIITAYRVSLIADTQAETIKTPAMFETHSFVILSSARVKADGVAGCSATVVAQDTYGYPVQGVSVTVAAARANSTTITPSGNQVSDTNGQCTWTLKSLWAGMDTITGASGARIIRRGVEKGVTGMWIFEEGAGTFTRDASGNSNTGILKNNPAWASGKYGSCLLYDGTNDYVAVPDASGLNPGTGSITVGAWVKTSQFPPDYEGDKIIVRKDTTGSPRTFWGLIMGGYEPSTKGSAGFQVVKIGTGGTTIFTADPINDGLWHHLAGVRDVTAGKLRLYIDGILKAEGDENLGDVTGSESLCFGNDASFFGTASSFQGLIDEVKLYNFALTVEEIAADRDNKANLFFTATRFMFATPQRTAVTDVASDSIVSEARGNSGGIDVVFNDSVSLSSSSITGRFSVDSGAWQDTSIVYFSAGSVVLYYKDSSPGTYSISVSRAGLLFETQAVIVTLTPVAETVSYLRVNTASIPANGSSACTVSIVIRNVSGQPVTGKTVFISTSRGTANDSVFYPYGQVTDASGICTAVIRSGFAGADTVIASCDGKIITENLVSNCSFENSSVFWDTGSAVVDTTVSRTGSKSLKLRATGSNAYGGYGETLSVTNNSWSVYGISGYIRATVTAGTYSLSVLYYSDTNAYLGSNNIGSLTSTTGSWTRFEKTYGGSGSGAQVLLPQTCSKIRLRACAWEGTPTGTGWTDDLRIKRIPTINFTGTKLKFSTAPFTAQVDVPSDQIVVEAQGKQGAQT
ncbi:hypothetical protein COS16_09210 [Candidatus Desantisbacteria bacterium CG02_land_8_20_14_3_00_49_13]|nr:MAG: hypothetical protein COS16_09210 [Candidatus Desantisbacteria bacterium CG02_land_8_20_14_3_00_49_13]